MKTLKIKKGGLPATVHIPASKSYANRALILASINPEKREIKNLPEATDVTNLISALKKAGLVIQRTGNAVAVMNSFPACENQNGILEIGEGGTTGRFMAALLTLGKKKHSLRLGKRLKDRPWDEFISICKELKVSSSLDHDLLTVQGPLLKPKSLPVDCLRTTQFATAFDLIFEDGVVIPLNLESSESYWKMNAPLKKSISGNSVYEVPADWSSASYPLAFAALHQDIFFPGLHDDPFQADAKFLQVLKELSVVKVSDEGIRISPILSSRPIRLSMNDCLDLFPAMVYLAAHLEGRHELTGLSNLIHKESNRLEEMCKLLEVFERKFEVRGDVLAIEGHSKLVGEKSLELPDDHRIVMTAALFLRHHNGGTIDRPESIAKSYPNFFELFH